MTREEAIEVITDYLNKDTAISPYNRRFINALDMAITALQQEEHLVELEAKAAAIIKSERHGEWECSQNKEYCIRADFKALVCSICGCNIPNIGQLPKNYCPNCGAKMKGGADK